MTKRFAVVLSSFVLLLFDIVLSYDNGIAATPPMGWSTWCTNDLCGLRDRCSEFEVRRKADAMVEQGMVDAGYNWILLDDCWADTERDTEGRLQPNHYQFPSGMRALSLYLHQRKMKLGLYTCIGTQTCKKGRPGSYGHYDIDAKTFASWGVDMVKADYCYKPGNESGQDLYTQFSKALNATGHPMLFALCQWGNDEVWEWAPEISQMYRVQMDHIPFFNWPATASGEGYGCGTKEIIDWMADLHPSKYVKPNAWMDPDFLETLFEPISMNYTNSRTEFSFWALWSAPLLVATDVANMTDAKKAILMNEEVLAVHHDPLYIAGERLFINEDEGQAWYRPLVNGDMAVILYNAGSHFPATVELKWEALRSEWKDKALSVRDLWAKKDLGLVKEGIAAHDLAVHDILMLRLSVADE